MHLNIAEVKAREGRQPRKRAWQAVQGRNEYHIESEHRKTKDRVGPGIRLQVSSGELVDCVTISPRPSA